MSMGILPASHRTSPPFGPFYYYRPASSSAAILIPSSTSAMLCRRGPRCFFSRSNTTWPSCVKSESLHRSHAIDAGARGEVRIQSPPTMDTSVSLRHSRHGSQYNEKFMDRYPANHARQATDGMLHKHRLSVEMVIPRMHPPTTGGKLTTADSSMWVIEAEKCRNSKRSHICKDGRSEVITSAKSIAEGDSDPRFPGNYPEITHDEKATVLYNDIGKQYPVMEESEIKKSHLQSDAQNISTVIAMESYHRNSSSQLLRRQFPERGVAKFMNNHRERHIVKEEISLNLKSLAEKTGLEDCLATQLEEHISKYAPEVDSTSEEHYTVSDENTEKLRSIYRTVLVVDSIPVAEEVVKKLTAQYKHLIHACDTEVARIDVKDETPVDHGEIICFSIYSGPEADFGNGKSCIWVDVLDGGGRDILLKFAPFFEDPKIKKVWHNYSFDHHIIKNYGIKLSGFHADTMHMARLWDSSRRTEGGYSLEALSGDPKVVGEHISGPTGTELIGKISMKTIFGKKKVKKDGTEGKLVTIAPVESLQREERVLWICYSSLDAVSTLRLYESLRSKLLRKAWTLDEKPVPGKSMLDFYREYWKPFGEILVKMESEGMLVDRAYLAEIEKLAKAEQVIAANHFRNWASRYCDDAKYMNVGSDTQLRQFLFGGTVNRKDESVSLPEQRTFKVPNVDGFVAEGKKAPSKFRDITLHSIGIQSTEMYTATGWPSVSGDALKILAGKVSAEYDFMEDTAESDLGGDIEDPSMSKADDVSTKQESAAGENVDLSAYGTAIHAFTDINEGREACHAIAALCEMCSIDSLISNFILPLQGSNVSGRDGRVHCSLNINTETGRLSARRPNLQNQPALEKDRYKIRQAFIAAPGKSLIVADYGQLELRILAHLADCKSMLDAFEAGGDFHSRTAMNMYQHIRAAVEKGQVILEWHPKPGEEKPPVPLLKDAFASERRKAKMLNFSIAYGKTPVGLARDWKVSVEEARRTVDLWYKERQEVLQWQMKRKEEAKRSGCVHTLLGRARRFPSVARATHAQKGHIERAAINTPVQGSAADVAMCAMIQIAKNRQLKDLGWKLLLQVHDEVILEGPTESAEVAKAIVVDCMTNPFDGRINLRVGLSVDAKCAQSWYAAK
ncbi:hypothetical protein MLD38_000533 [Melastoma candidum]|uniref:Uncharacterized protein n=1 Tax=Melastoma candidum TaxID=119954 RepID=A0ACB9SAG1_9MYRT|nr:hypothetical protein MLD38_000533 [Melastoma candidum]